MTSKKITKKALGLQEYKMLTTKQNKAKK